MAERGPGSALRTSRWVAAQLLPERRLLLVFLIAAIGSNLAATFVPLYTGKAFAVVTAPGIARSDLLMIMLSVLGLVVGRFLAEAISIGAVETVAQRLKRDSRDELFRSLLRKGQPFHDRQNIGDILSRTVNDGKLLDYMVGLGLPMAVNGLLAIGLSITFIALTDERLLLAPMAIAVIFTFSLWHHVRRLQPLSHRTRVAFAEFNQTLADTLGGIATVKALAVEDHERKKAAAAAELYRQAFTRRGRSQAIYLPGLSFAVGMAIGVSQSLVLYETGQLALHEVITYLGWLALFAHAITASEQAVPLLQDGFVAAARVREITDAIGDDDVDAAGVEAAISGSLKFDGVSLRIAGRTVLQDISFHLPAGATMAVTGPTGSGKSALIKLINRTYEASDGDIFIDGQAIGGWRLRSLRRQIATVHQDTFLFSKSIHENIAFGVRDGASRRAVETAAEQASARDFILALEGGYETVLNEGGSTLSGGQRQRLGIARALITSPSILIMDDATSALDATTAAAVSGQVRSHMTGRTTVLVTHEPHQIRDADLILVLDAGRVVDMGSHESLRIRCPLYQELYAD
ncbi:ABC transporter ATP-binding protein [Sphingomonas sp. HF-S4]|uniref:ABC transporter ATP-binding protein n=1 Tax=Sphingomonas agrestis TaxID=3080540 RepID=A0ABU3YCM1_9SPHN|nr:ABC transporter ATP-binding protein [Sphingomonas sp. HF-S4]MDV3458933.1 ABC transporter ATP-binding protein [Sphingomonas sp. HF-S4]